MRTLMNCTAVLLVAGWVVGVSPAQVPDLAGSWSLETAARLPNEELPCQFEGSAMLSQTGAQLLGDVTLMLTTGSFPSGCPGDMSASLTGAVSGIVTGTLEGGMTFGRAVFTGTIAPGAKSMAGTLSFQKRRTASLPAANGGSNGSGGFSVSSGPFVGATGTWSANQEGLSPVPTLGEFGIMLLVALLLVSGVMVMRRNPA